MINLLYVFICTSIINYFSIDRILPLSHFHHPANDNPLPAWNKEFRNEEELINCLFDNYKLEDDALLLVCETDLQSMKLFSLKGGMACYSVSTSGKGTGNEEGSFLAPLGMHQIISVVCEN